MTLQDDVRSLHRYARALTLSSSIADAYVRETLDVFLDEISGVADASFRRRLFSIFHQIWPCEEAGDDHPGEVPCVFDASLRSLDTECRSAVLLVEMEAFPLREAALIMNAPVAKVERWLLAALRELDPASASVRIDAHWMDSSFWGEVMDVLEFDDENDFDLSLLLHARGRMVKPLRVRMGLAAHRPH